MSTYRAGIRVDDDTLTTFRPLTAPKPVRELVDWAQSVVVDSGGELVSVELVVETSTDSDTPVGDSIAATSSTPLAPTPADDEDGTSATVGGQS